MYIFYAKSIVHKRGISKLFLTFRKWHQPFKSIGRGKLKNKAWKTKQKDYVFRLKNMHFDVFPFTMILSFLHGDTNCVWLPIHKLSWFEALNRYITHILFLSSEDNFFNDVTTLALLWFTKAVSFTMKKRSKSIFIHGFDAGEEFKQTGKSIMGWKINNSYLLYKAQSHFPQGNFYQAGLVFSRQRSIDFDRL